MECLGGNGYVEESIMPRLYRETPVNSIWEGSGNVNALDLLRAFAKQPHSLDAYLAEVALAGGADAHFDRALASLRDDLAGGAALVEAGARRTVERMALVLQGSLLIRHAPAATADAFCASRLGGDWGAAFGTLSPRADLQKIVERSWPN
jgi:putative acyl-CoA dehydrogenase